ncbi:MAG TPA: transcription-repair coupling factor, partial [Porticoccaceae bacterium]|nr:transcription-repair coupling factor [Porticoccaceae bacterium]
MPNIFDPPLPQGSNIAYWKQLHGTAVSLAISNAAANCEGPLLVVCEDNEAAGRLKRELKYFCKAKANLDVFSLPDWETLPYDIFSPHQDIISDRLRTLYHMPQLRTGIIVVSVTSLMHKLPPKAYIAANSFNLEIGQLLHIDTMRSQLISAGYQSVSSVYEHGEFAVRGSIIDIFPMGSVQPFRIDLFDDEIETLQNFDPETQRSNNRVDSIRLLPGREFPLDKKGIATFRGKFRDLFDVDVRQCPIYQDVSDGISSPGLEYYLDLFFDGLSSLFDYLPASTRCCKVGNLNAAGEKFWQDIGSRYADREVDRLRPILRPDQIFIVIDFVQAALKRYPQIEFKDSSAAADFKTTELPDLSSNPKL